MSVLGRSELIKLMNEGALVVSPLLSQQQLGAASIDLRMGNVVLIARARGTSHVDPSDGQMSDTEHDIEADRQQKHERYEIPFHGRFLLHPGSVALVPTLEWLKFPPNLIGAVTARSSWAREGLNIATATLVEPNYQGIVTLELSNLGQIPMALSPGLRIAQIAFTKVEGDTRRPNRGQFDMSFEPVQGVIAKEDDRPFLRSG